MTAYAQAVRAEIAKVTTTRMWWIIAVVMVGYIALMAGGLGAVLGFAASQNDDTGLPPGLGLERLLYSFATSIGYVFPVLVGALSVTGEYRHQTVTPTFLAVPRRGLALGAKFAVQAGLGAVYGVLAFLGSVVAGAAALSAFGMETGLGGSDVWLLILRGIVAMALWSVIGVGLGALVRNQVAAIVIVLAFTQFLEPVLRFAALLSPVTATIGKFLPGAASDGLVGASFLSVGGMGGGALSPAMLAPWQGGLVLLTYALAAVIGGYFTSWRKDVT